MRKHWPLEQYLDCLGNYDETNPKCSWCTRETQSDCIEYGELQSSEPSSSLKGTEA